MPGNRKVFISHSHADDARCQPLLNALKQWGIEYWFDAEQLNYGENLSEGVQNALASHDIFIRVCSTAMQQRPYWVDLETGAFRGLQAEDENAGLHGKRVIISLVLDAGYQLQNFERANIYIDAAREPQNVWLPKLQRALTSTTPASGSIAPLATRPITRGATVGKGRKIGAFVAPGGVLALLVVFVLSGAAVSLLKRAGVSAPGVGSSATATKSALATYIPAGWHETDDSLADNSAGNHWQEFSALFSECKFENSSYRAAISSAGSIALCYAQTDANFTDVAFQVDMQDFEYGGGGIVLRGGTGGGYFFGVWNHGNGSVDVYVKSYNSGGAFTTLKAPDFNSLNIPFKKELNATNTLAAVANGSTLTFLINGKLVTQVTDTTYTAGEIGVGAGTATEVVIGGVHVKNAKIWSPA